MIKFLSELVTKERFLKFHKVLDLRTRYITVVLEDLFQTHNASAVLRTCDCLGIQDVHFIENQFFFNENPEVALGSSKWLSLLRYHQYENNTLSTINFLKEQGYRIVATTPHTNEVSLENLSLSSGKIALLFGSELPGLSDIAMQNADEFVKIEMYGFTESFNISISVALFLYQLTTKLRNSDINWQLEESEKDELLVKWLKTSIKDSENIIKQYFKS
ncbi:MAG: RNA methyltransferase [Bacteroidales bacterium]|nr:RNA methyltransferase [Bacteroidales bacterium]